MNEGDIIRRAPRKGKGVVLDGSIFSDRRLSLDAKGYWGVLQAKGISSFDFDDLNAEEKVLVGELIECGYLEETDK